MPRPRIGITSNMGERGQPPKLQTYLAASYCDAVFAAGGMPCPLPVLDDHSASTLDDLIAPLDAIVLTGGLDPDAARFGQSQHPATRRIHPRRESFEFALFAHVDQRRLPALGICLGHQVAHIARGGAIVQHVERDEQVPHYRADDDSSFHPVTVSGALREILGREQVTVCSRHHQVVTPEQVGRGLTTVALSPDGYVEASADTTDGRFLLTVQWHPEDQGAEMLPLFAALVQGARERAS